MNRLELIYDVIGIGFGPANIAIACSMEESDFKYKTLFLESKQEASWQENMLFENSDIQNHPLRDLVTPRNPRSKYSFTNFLFEHDRLFEHLNVGMTFPFREEFAQYIKWVASHFSSLVNYNTRVENVELIHENGEDEMYKISDSKGQTYFSRSIIVAPGRTPNIPSEFKEINSKRVIFLSDFLNRIQEFDKKRLKNIAVVGGSQSAVEIILHLTENYPDTNIAGFIRKFGYLQKDVNPFTGEVYYPEFGDLFYKSSQREKDKLISDLYLTNYSASDADVLDSLYRKMYLQKIKGKSTVKIHRSSTIVEASVTNDEKIQIAFDKIESDIGLEESFDLVVLATGFKNTGVRENEERLHPLLKRFENVLNLDKNGCAIINRDYSLDFDNQEINTFFLNGLCESSHGMGDAGSFSLLALRSMIIVESLNNALKEKKKKGNQVVKPAIDWVI